MVARPWSRRGRASGVGEPTLVLAHAELQGAPDFVAGVKGPSHAVAPENARRFGGTTHGTPRAPRRAVSRAPETVPPASGEVDSPQRVILCSTRVALSGSGDAILAADVAELLIALHDTRRVTVVIDVGASSIDVEFFVRLASDFPSHVGLIVEGDPAIDRQKFHAHGVYRAQFEPFPSGLLAPGADGSVDRAELVARVALKMARSPTPIANLRRG